MRASRLATCLWTVAALCVSVPALSATQDIAVTAENDRLHQHNWYYGGSDWWWTVNANPNQVSHSYEPGWGNSSDAFLTFSLTPVQAIALADINSVTLIIDVLSLWTDGRDNLANLNAGGNVSYGNGVGLHSFDVTTYVKNALAASATTVDLNFVYTGYSGFTFGAAEGNDPAVLRFDVVGAVPEPASFAMLLAGLGVVAGVAARRRPETP